MKERAFRPAAELCLHGRKLEEVDLPQVPPMGERHRLQLFLRLRQGDVQSGVPAPHSLEQKVDRQRRLSYTRISLHQVEPIAGQTTTKDVVQTFHTHRASVRSWYRVFGVVHTLHRRTGETLKSAAEHAEKQPKYRLKRATSPGLSGVHPERV